MTNLLLHGASHNPQNLAASAAWDTLTGATQAVVQFTSPMQNGSMVDFPIGTAQTLWARGQLYMHTWGMWDLSKKLAWPTSDLLSGKFDAYLTRQAQLLAAFRHPVFIRLDAEMNGAWEAWFFADGAEYVKRWRYVVDLFRRNGATNATWVWCPNQMSVATVDSTAANKAAAYYPGDDHVDWTGYDAYNFPPRYNSKWLTFAQVSTAGFGFADTYGTIARIAPAKPLFVGEFGCSDTGGPTGTLADKATWLATVLATTPTLFPLIRGLSYFDWNAESGTSWALNATTGPAWGAGLGAGPYVKVGGFTMPPDLRPILPFTQTVVSGDPLSDLASIHGQVAQVRSQVASIQSNLATAHDAAAQLVQHFGGH